MHPVFRHSMMIFAAVAAAGCAGTQEAEKSMTTQFLGKPSDAFFAQYGAAQSSTKLNDGGTVYDWIGGRGTVNVPPVYRTAAPPMMAMPAMGGTETHSKTTVSNPSPGTTVTTTKSTSVGFSVGVPTAMQVMVTPAQTVEVFCEAQITTNAQGIITHIHASNDTRGMGMSVSRCAEVFGVN